MPPRHGKSELISHWLPVWLLNLQPEARVMLAAYGDEFAARWGRLVRNSITENAGILSVRLSEDSKAAHRWNTPQGGGMVTAGIGGPFTGLGSNVLICDDPIKNSIEAESATYRERIWDWWQSTAYTRLEPGGTAVVVMTRWHEDDLCGRLLAEARNGGEYWEELRLPALAEEDDPLGRELGEALWPQRYDLEALEQIRQAVGSYRWAALYQQRPAPREGNLFKVARLDIVDAAPAVARRWRCWDHAATEGAGDYTVGVLMSATAEGTYYVEDVVRGQWGPGERTRIQRQTAELDRQRDPRIRTRIPQDPGSAGKDSVIATIKALAGYSVIAETETGDKTNRAEPLASQVEAGNVRLVRAPWNRDYIEELRSFPAGAHDDQVDSSSAAFNLMARRRSMAAL